ncbi:NACHT, LRR and PYD domains-containing protein 12-like [Chanos chanos]|uniref:NACHT, LRR and PYD domains-containing protein 12-like n=1 Tax=Chanos chanos TaxID=29144 RepID=A0A6J2VNF3_CHACN|nr:NACHT, LRR and PYD domains-containing protein 12-like [Chanos chanos]
MSVNYLRVLRTIKVAESTSLDVLLTNLIKGNLLPSALVWVTSRPAAASQIHSKNFHDVTEIQGFYDLQKEKCFRKRISDQNLANRIISHIKSSRSLRIMSHIPVFCWISATVLENMLGEEERRDSQDSDSNHLENCKLIFYEEDLRQRGIDVREASVFSGLCPQVFREEFELLKEENSEAVALVSNSSVSCRRQDVDLSNNIPQDSGLKVLCTDLKYPYSKLEVLRYGTSMAELIIREKYKSYLRKRFQFISEGTMEDRNPRILNEIYTDLYIMQSGSNEVRNEHEVRQIETLFRTAATEDTSVRYNDIFKPLPGQDKPIRTVLTTGIAGIGKTITVQKFILDWAEGKVNQDIHYIFPLLFRELNFMKDQKHSLTEILSVFFTEMKEFDFSYKKHKVLFIFDGLDECRLSLDFQKTKNFCDVTESASLDVLLTNLINGNLLPSALIWITSRPAAANQIPPQHVDSVTEIRGFSNSQKEEYFRKRINDQNLTSRIISHIKSSRSLYTMCHIPVFCWISATVLERMLVEAENGEIPKTLTEMYTHFLLKIIRQRCAQQREKDKMIFKLGKLAFQQLMKGNMIFYEEDLRECGIDVEEASVYSGVCTLIFREELGWYQGKVYCFVHLSVQEHLAALYAHLSLVNNHRNELNQHVFSALGDKIKSVTIFDLHKSTVDQALQSKNGHLDLFLCFLLGLSVESNQVLLKDLLTQTEKSMHSNVVTVDYIKKRISENISSEKSINLFHCLNELNDRSLVEEIQKYISSGSLTHSKLSNSQWSAVVFAFLTSEEVLDVFDLKKFAGSILDDDNSCITSDEILLRLLPVLKASRKAWLSHCKLTEKSCAGLASVLSSDSSSLRELKLRDNNLQDSGVKLLSAGLANPHCKLEILNLSDCKLTDKSCASLASALNSNPSSLRVMNLGFNNLQDFGVELLSTVLQNPHCNLKVLRLGRCNLSERICAVLAAVLSSSSSSLRELGLSDNCLQDSGVKLLSDGLKNPYCKLEILRLRFCKLTEGSGSVLASVLSSNSSKNLRELDLSYNKLQDKGMNLLSAELENPNCKLDTLRLICCNLTEKCCSTLASALSSCSLRELDLNLNYLHDSGVKLLCAGLENPHCKLEILRLYCCELTEKSCAVLASVLSSSTSSLRELDLSGNKLQDSGVELLSVGMKNPHSKLETLRLRGCELTEKSCLALASALSSNSSSLRELDLSNNNLQDVGVELLSPGLKNLHCTLEILS